MIDLTAPQLAAATGARIAVAAERLPAYLSALTFYNIDTRLRMACLLANVGHESAGFQYAEEIWGPSEAQKGYEGRADLGNLTAGDGHRYRGRGDFETTGRKNYAALRDRLRKRFPGLGVPDFEADPDSLALPQWAALSACDFADQHSLNAYADVANFDFYCDAVNRGHTTVALGDANGFPQRLRLFVAGMRVLP